MWDLVFGSWSVAGGGGRNESGSYVLCLFDGFEKEGVLHGAVGGGGG